MPRPLVPPQDARRMARQERTGFNLMRRPQLPTNIAGLFPLAYEYAGLFDATLGGITYSEFAGPFQPGTSGGGTNAVYQNGGTPDAPTATVPEGSLIIGQGAWRYETGGADFDLSGATELRVWPTWRREYGPTLREEGGKIGTGVIQQFSQADPDTIAPVPTWEIDCFAYDGYVQLRLAADGSLISDGDPITWADGDHLSVYWHCFVHSSET